MYKVYQVIKKFDSRKDHGFSMRPQYARCLEVMNTGEKINAKEFAKEHRGEFVIRRNTLESNLADTHIAFEPNANTNVLYLNPFQNTKPMN
ncbi:hypothetical protein NZNM25_10440 [Nitrosopumilus zosterae]|uniref:Uncharacterized protein n=1 Tax=Nitrosopumilus zosterae TaxID=718286 RepID=A0A2S2KRH5_9ARCH|nr:hypothetical protein [Nitrosopumilus zosterae]BDQ30312.1 hypothetical protein NZOSNM25_000414 [Nitrosopumilus zosterae]GBH34253.1 hypothetical protein NZNM25_10440 [Nitrosopumilus zosterae]